MKKTLLTLMLVSLATLSYAGSKLTYTTDIVRSQDKTTDNPTTMRVSTNVLIEAFGLSSEDALEKALSAGTVAFLAKQGNTNKTYSTPSWGNHGYWFTKGGIGCAATNANRRVACQYANGYFNIVHNSGNDSKGNALVNTGDQYTFATLFVQGADTVQYVFNLTIGSDERIDTDQPEYVEVIEHRADEMDQWALQPLVRQNEGEWLQQNYIQVMEGDRITFDVGDKDGNTVTRVRYQDKSDKQLRAYKAGEFVLTESATKDDAGHYTCSIMYKDADGTSKTQSCHLYVDVQTQPIGTPWDWTGEVPQFGYNFRDEYPTLTMPTKIHDIKKKDGTPANCVAGDWWCVFWGDDLNDAVGGQEKAREAAQNMVKKYDEDFLYIYENIGWPPNLSARNGYKSMIYIFGSGLANDNEDKATMGGYQGSTYANGQNYACVWASYYPFSRFRSDADQLWSDGEYQREAMIHEGIHTLFADMDACHDSPWFHEGGNVWTQGELHALREKTYGTPGWLCAGPVTCPYIPIECYSGWLQDGSFGGPAAEGVNMYGADGQICTWRNLIGGGQYAEVFPTVLSVIAGSQSVGWIWRNCKSRILETIGDHIGDAAMRNLITQYRARIALFDLGGGWDKGYRQIARDNYKKTVRAEWRNGVMEKANKSSNEMPCWIDVEPFTISFYQSVRRNSADGWMAPDEITNPGWSGANNIPIHVKTGATYAEVEFRPEDTSLRALLCYRTKAGKCHYSQPVACGTMHIDLTGQPANGVITCVVINTDYEFKGGTYGEQLRKHHYDYRLRLGDNALAVADIFQEWYMYESTITDPDYDEAAILTGIQGVSEEPTADGSAEAHVSLLPVGTLRSGSTLRPQLDGVRATDVTVRLVSLSGTVVDVATLSPDGTYTLPAALSRGLYLIQFLHHGKSDTCKVIIN